MPTSARKPDLLVDTSVAVALSTAGHEFHGATADAVGGRQLGLAGHAAFETFSVLTRLPAPDRRPPATVIHLLRENFPATRHLSAEAAADLFGRLTDGEIAGGSVYDALVGATAIEHGALLATRDRRALDTYRALGVEIELLA